MGGSQRSLNPWIHRAVARFPDFLFSLDMQTHGSMIDPDSVRQGSARGTSWMLGVVVAMTLAVSGPKPAQAGVVGDAINDVSAFLADLDRTVSAWFFGVVDALDQPDRMELAAAAVRRMAIEAPASLASTGHEAGFSLSGYKVSQVDQGHLLLTFGFEREIETDSRMAMWRDVLVAAADETRPELELTRALLDASDWRLVDIGADYTLVGVEIEVGETLTTHMIYELIRDGV